MLMLCLGGFEALSVLFPLGIIMTIPFSVYLLNKFIDELHLRKHKAS